MLRVVHLSASIDQIANLSDVALDSLRDLIDILRFHNRLQVVLQDFGKVVLQLRATEIFQNLLPVRGVVIATQIGLQLATEDLESRAFANTICSDKTQDLAGAGHRKPMELEAVGRVPVRHFDIEVGRQVDNMDGPERTLFRADTATDAETFRDEGNLGIGSDLNTQLACADHGARLFALLATFLE